MCDGRVIDGNAELLRDLQGRQLPQPTEQPLGGAAHDHDLVAARDPQERAGEHRQLARLLAHRHHRELVLTTRRVRGAQLRERADEAARLGWRAHGGAELHQALVEIAGRRYLRQRGHQLACPRPQRLSSGGALDVGLDREHAAEHPGDVAIDERRALAVRDRCDRARGVGPDARHLAQLGGAAGQGAAPRGAHLLSAAMQIARARVIAEACPRREDVVERCAGEGVHRREPRHPALPVRDHGGDAGLLQHDLADPDRIRVARTPPREIALHAAVVRDHGPGDRCEVHRPEVYPRSAPSSRGVSCRGGA